MMPLRFMGRFQGAALGRLSEALARVALRGDVRAPGPVPDVPVDGLRQSRLERLGRTPAELAGDLRAVDRVAPVVAGAVGDELDLRRVRPSVLAGRLRVEERADE